MRLFKENPTLSEIMGRNTRKQLAIWVKELLWVCGHTTDRDVYVSQLREKNHRQAAMLMEKEMEMLKLVVNNDDTLEPVLKLAPKDPNGGGDWLSTMVCGTEFLVKFKGEPVPWLLREYTHCGKKEGNVLLSPTVTINDPKSWMWVDPVEFCKVFELRGVLEVPDE